MGLLRAGLPAESDRAPAGRTKATAPAGSAVRARAAQSSAAFPGPSVVADADEEFHHPRPVPCLLADGEREEKRNTGERRVVRISLVVNGADGRGDPAERSDRLLDRQRRQDDAVHPRTRAWDGDWEMVVITATGRGPAERADLRARLTGLRLAELREGVWLRPANLARALPGDLDQVAQHYTARPGGPGRDLAAALWPLDAWSATARALLVHIAGASRPADRLTAFAAVVRHLVADPVLPSGLQPAGWPGADLRAAYTDYQRELIGEVRARVGGV